MKGASSLIWVAVPLIAASVALPVASASGAEVVRSFSDLNPGAQPASYSAVLSALAPSLCPTGRPAGTKKKVSLVRAAGDARTVLTRGKTGKAFKKLVHKAGKKAVSAEAFGVAGAASGNAGAALAGFLSAHDREPKDALHLVNVSVVLTQIGKPADGLAFALAALKARAPARPPFGLSTRALALNAQGFALFHLLRFTEAATAFRKAAALEPLLREAKINLAGALLCGGHAAQAAEPYANGQRRNVFSATAPADSAVLPEAVFPDTGNAIARPEAVLDMSQSQEWTLPKVTFPAKPANGAASADGFDALEQTRHDQSRAASQEVATLSLQVSGGATTLSPAQLREIQIWGYFTSWETFNPDLQKILKQDLPAFHDQLLAMHQAFLDRYASIVSGCDGQPASQRQQCVSSQCTAELNARHQDWLTLQGQTDAAVRNLTKGLSRYGTALAANLANPVAHQVLIKAIETLVYDTYSVYDLGAAQLWTSLEKTFKTDCIDAPPDNSDTETDAEAFVPGLSCPPELRLVSWTLSLPLPEPPGSSLDIAVKCEDVTVGVSTKPPLGGFAEIQYKFASGDTTIFAGPKLSAGAFSAKGGVYLTVNGKGDVSDVGIKGSIAAGAKSEPVKLGGAGFKGTYSLAPMVL